MVALLLTAVCVAGLVVHFPHADARVDLLADTSSPAYRQQAAFARAFGGDPVVVVIAARPGKELLTPDHMVAFASLEGGLARKRGVSHVYGPGTLVNTLAAALTNRGLDICSKAGTSAETAAIAAAAAAGKTPPDQQTAGQAAFDAAVRDCVQKLAGQFPSIGLPAVNNPAFYGVVLLEPDGTHVRPFWTWALPQRQQALVTVRMKPDATSADVLDVVNAVETASAKPQFSDAVIHVAGSPTLTAELGVETLKSLIVLLVLTLIAMVVVTFVVLLRVGYRLMAIPLAVLAAVWTAGLAAWAQLPLTPATLAVLPVVLGLGTDYALQAANRLAEETGTPAERARAMAAGILPATLLAALATAGGVLVFAISPVPLVRQFAFVLAMGVACCWLASVLVGVPVTALLLRHGWAVRTRPAEEDGTHPPSWGFIHRIASAPPVAVLGLGVLGLAGWAGLPFVKIETDVQRLMPAGSPAVAQAQEVVRTLHLGGELDLVITGRDTSSPESVAWLEAASAQAVSGSNGRLVQLNGLTTLLKQFNSGTLPDATVTARVLQNMPPYFQTAVISGDHRIARSVLGQTSLTSVEEDRAIIAGLDALPPAPAGYQVYPAGLAVLASGALAQLQSEQVLLNALAIVIVLMILLAAYRRPKPALLAVLPAVVAAGWATGILFVTGYRTSPIAILMAGVVVAFATEFSVLWMSRYRHEAASGWLTPMQASEIASRRIGPAIVASALALVLGFLILAVSDVPIVRDFGLLSGADLALASLSVLVILPPLARAWIPKG